MCLKLHIFSNSIKNVLNIRTVGESTLVEYKVKYICREQIQYAGSELQARSWLDRKQKRLKTEKRIAMA